MSPQVITMHVLLGLVIGCSLGYAHALASRRAATRALELERPGLLLLGFPLRIAIPGAALFALTLLSAWALAGGMLAFLAGSRLALGRGRETTAAP